MAIVVPFRGVLYNLEKIEDFSKVTAPPYDIISPEQQEGYYQKSPYNVIRLILGKQFPHDLPEDNRYTRAAGVFDIWQEKSILIRDEKPSFYFYRQEFSVSGKEKVTRDGFIGLVRLEDKEKRVVIPHEKTLDKPKEDRLQLMEACHANFSSIFSLYSDPEDVIIQQLKKMTGMIPLLEVTDEDNTRHQLWRISQMGVIKQISQHLRDSSLFIADGHHRYETALNYRNLQIERYPQSTGKEAYNYVMMYLTSMEGEGLVILPYHRVIHNLEGFDFGNFEKKLEDYFEVKTFQFSEENEMHVWEEFNKQLQDDTLSRPAFGMYGAGQACYHLLVLKEEVFFSLSDSGEGSEALKKLDVNIIESVIFKDVLGITSNDLQQEQNMTYVHDGLEGLELVRDKGYQLAFFLNSTKSSEIRDIASRGETMPQKSTYFYPKLLSGTVINKIVPEESIEFS
ncbi:MAG: DUF1015 domain-containing protein [Deltaproteobacteria bacterium]|nr:DUF1015 domain-containing protein [Deltaproteobacteria bacterium]